MRMRFRLSMRARMSSVSRTSCLTLVLIVVRLDAMKSARRPGSVMFDASVCRSSDSSGESDTTCWKFVLILRASASISNGSASLVPWAAAVTRARRYGSVATSDSRVSRASPWTISRKLPSGSLNILWMCVAVPTEYRSASAGSSTAASRCVKTAISFPLAIASSISRTELSRATASGMNELGNSTVSRSGRIGNSAGMASGRSPVRLSSIFGSTLCSVIGDLLSRDRRWGGIAGSATGGALWDAGILHVREERRRAAPGRELTLALLGDLAGLLAVLAANRERQRAEPLLGDLFTAFEAVAVVALLEPQQRVVDLVQRLRLHLDQRELDVVLDVGFRALDRVEDLVLLVAPRAFFARVPDFVLDLGANFPPAVNEHRFQFGIPISGFPVYLRCHLHFAAPSCPTTPFRPSGDAAVKIAVPSANELPI